ncbi:hypothetical protein [Campylobacter concisus]|nr:hypothetical protein [Campylobacter concisus]
MVNPTTTDYKANEGATNMQMYDHHNMMMKNMSDDNSTNIHIHN